MLNDTHDAFTYLPGATRCHFLRLVEGPTSWWLQAFNLREGNVQIELTEEQVRALLLAFPPGWLRTALGLNQCFDLDDPLEQAEIRAELRRLNGMDHYA